GAHLISTDVWASMGQEDEVAARMATFRAYQVDRALLDSAADDVLFMHCLPAHRGEEISEDLLDDPRSVAWDQAENRLHAQNALLEFLVARASNTARATNRCCSYATWPAAMASKASCNT